MAGSIQLNLALLLARAGQRQASLRATSTALDIARGFGTVTPTLELHYALDLIETGRAREAIPLIEHALVDAQAEGDRRSVGYIEIEGARAWCLTEAMSRCIEMTSKGRDDLTALLPAGHASFGNVALARARVAVAVADLPQARTLLLEAVAIFDAGNGRSTAEIRALALLARTELQLGDLDAAEAHAARAVAQAGEMLAGFDHSEWLGNALVARGLVQQARGQGTAAETSWQAAVGELQAAAGDTAPATIEARTLLAGR